MPSSTRTAGPDPNALVWEKKVKKALESRIRRIYTAYMKDRVSAASTEDDFSDWALELSGDVLDFSWAVFVDSRLVWSMPTSLIVEGLDAGGEDFQDAARWVVTYICIEALIGMAMADLARLKEREQEEEDVIRHHEQVLGASTKMRWQRS